MSKTIVRSLLFALAGVFAMNLNAAVTWSSTSCAPTDWTPLADNLLFGLTGTINGSVAGSGYASSDPALMTDGSVPTTSGKDWIVGFQNGTTITWGFLAPKTIDSVRISCGYLAGVTYSGFKVSAVEVKTVDSDNWRKVNADVGGMNATAQADILSLTLSVDGGDALAESVVSLRVTFASPPIGFANYCAEIEAVGSSSVSGPVIGSFGVAPAKTKATVSGSIADVGTDATACDVYFALNGAEAVKIA